MACIFQFSLLTKKRLDDMIIVLNTFLPAALEIGQALKDYLWKLTGRPVYCIESRECCDTKPPLRIQSSQWKKLMNRSSNLIRFGNRQAIKPIIILSQIGIDPDTIQRLRRQLMPLDPESYAFWVQDASDQQNSAQHRHLSTQGDCGLLVQTRDQAQPTAVAVQIADLLFEKINLQQYSPDWVRLFEHEKEILEKQLRQTLSATHAVPRQDCCIEHIGSTAIPGLDAKSIIDIMLGLPVFRQWQACLEPLYDCGYHFMDYPENKDRRFFRKGIPRQFHLHLVACKGQEWLDHLDFRSALAGDPELRQNYQQLKRSLAQSHSRSRDSYGRSKGNFIRRSLADWRAKQSARPAS
ncbi:MAG: GrpB family protein [Leptospiraceae bacterium]|nr:GrpB family protein [Leptospiraceae bacterium]